MKIAYLFDIDGTITPSRNIIDPEFRDWFLKFQKSHDVYLVTGSDYPKTLEQVGEDICNNSKLLFNCCGNEVRKGNELLYLSDWKGTPELISVLEQELENSEFPTKTGRHIEVRTGLINFSVVGRNADRQQRQDYVNFDKINSERENIANKLTARFSDIEFAIAGETGIDIYPVGKDKSQALTWVEADVTRFFGDMIVLGGNDWGIAQHATENYPVKDWKDTHKILREMAKDI